MNRDVTFRRINGRIVPIRSRGTEPKKTTPPGMTSTSSSLVKVGAGFGLSAASGFGAGALINQSWKAYGRSAHMRGFSKGLANRVPKQVINQAIKDSARFKVTGKVLSKRGFGILGLGIATGAGMVVSGLKSLMDKKRISSESQAQAIAAGTAAATAVGLTVFGRKAGIKHITKALRMSGGMNVKNALHTFTTQGKNKTSNIIRQYSKMVKTEKPTFTARKLDRIMKKSKKYDIPGQGNFNL